MKDKINAILIKDINHFIKDEIPYYTIINCNDEYIISDLPIIVREYIGELTNYLVYDYDNFNDKNKEKYKDYVKTFYKHSEKYILQTKIYTKKRK